MSVCLKDLWLKRPKNANKLTCGRLLCIAGSEETVFPAYLNILAALRTGLGWVMLGAPHSVCNTLSESLLEVKMVPLSKGSKAHITLDPPHKKNIENSLHQAQALILGCGLGPQEEVYGYFVELLADKSIPCVIDAAALLYFWKHINKTSMRCDYQVWTPNLWELKLMFGQSFLNLSEADRIQKLQTFSQKCGMTWIYKTPPSKIINADGVVYENNTGNPGMASTGMGDVLSGLIGGFLAQGMTILESCKAGMGILGLSGDLCYQRLGNGLRAHDVCEAIPTAIQNFVSI